MDALRMIDLIIQGDCIEVLKTLEPEYVEIIKARIAKASEPGRLF